jgi:hypothetical protein
MQDEEVSKAEIAGRQQLTEDPCTNEAGEGNGSAYTLIMGHAGGIHWLLGMPELSFQEIRLSSAKS